MCVVALAAGLLAAGPSVAAEPAPTQELVSEFGKADASDAQTDLRAQSGRYPIPSGCLEPLPVSFAAMPRPVIDENGAVTLFCHDASGVFAIRSEDRKTWANRQDLFAQGMYLAVASNQRGDILLINVVNVNESRDRSVTAARFNALSGSWQVDPLCVGTQDSCGVDDASIGEDGTAAIAWVSYVPGTSVDQVQVRVARPGEAFGPAEVAATGNINQSSVVVGEAGRVDLVWGWWTFPLHHQWRNPGTGEWSRPTELCCSSQEGIFLGDGTSIHLVSDGAGRLVLLSEYAFLYFDGTSWTTPKPFRGQDFRGFSGVAGGSGRLYALWTGKGSGDGLIVGPTRLLEVDASTGELVERGDPIMGVAVDTMSYERFSFGVDSSGMPYALLGRSTARGLDYLAVTSDGRVEKVFADGLGPSDSCRTGGMAMNGSGQGVRLIMCGLRTDMVEPRSYFVQPFGPASNSCVRVPSDGGPLESDGTGQVRAGPTATAETSRPSLRFGAVEAVGCFEPLARSDSAWAKVVSTAGMWVNSADLTRINGIDVPAAPGTLLFDTKAMRISWLPTSEIALAMQGTIFYRFLSKGSFKNPFSLPVKVGQKTINLTPADPLGSKDKPAPRILGVDLRKDAAISLDFGVDKEVGGYTQVRATLGFAGTWDKGTIKSNPKAEAGTKCSARDANVVVRNSQGRLMKCEAINPQDPKRTSRWVQVEGLQTLEPGISATIRASNKNGLELREVKGSIKHLAVGPVQLENVELAYGPATATKPAIWSMKGSTGIKVGIGRASRNVKVTLGGALAYDTSPTAQTPLYLQGLTFGVEGIPIPTGGPTAIRRLSGSWDRGDALGGWSLSGGMSWIIGPTISVGPDDYDTAALDVTYTFKAATLANPSDPMSKGEPASLTVQGAGKIVGVPMGQVTAQMSFNDGLPAFIDRIELEGDVSLDKLPWKWAKKLGISGSAKIVGYYDFVEKRYQLQGAVRDLSIKKLKVGPFGGDIMISDRGFAVCAQVPTVSVVAVGYSYRWATDESRTHLANCDVAVVRSGS